MSFNRRESDRPSGYSYLDGVPVKIGERFRPPRKVTLPLSYQQRYPVDLLNEEYDFSLESQVLELAKTKRRGKEAVERAKTEKLASTIEDFTRLIDGTKACEDDFWTTRATPRLQEKGVGSTGTKHLDNVRADDETVSNGMENGSTPRAATMEPNTMLKPIPLESAASTKPDVTMITSQGLNLADFESESSPFDSMALKTINDLEELKSVLQNTNVSDGQLKSFRSDDDLVQETNFIEAHGTSSMHHQHVTNYTFFSAVPIPGPSPAHHEADTSSGVGPHSLPSHPALFSHPVAENSPSSKCSPSEDVYATLVPLRNSRSTPDLLKELGVALAAERERKKLASISSGSFVDQHLQRPSSMGVIAEAMSGSHKTHRDDAIYTKDERNSIEYSHASNLPVDPTEAEVDSHVLVSHVTDMGFPRNRVARAVHKIGIDDKKVVEYLCMVQSFVEAGHSAEDAEKALFLHDLNDAQAKKYLDLLSQFKDLGFDEELIQKALLHANNDRDKALDFLVSL